MSANLMSLARNGGKFLKLFGDRKMVRTLPYLRRVAYLESHETEWIDTGIIPTEATSCKLDGQFRKVNVTQINGVFDDSHGNLGFDIGVNNGKWFARRFGGNTSSITADTNRHVFEIISDESAFSIDGTKYNLTFSFGSFSKSLYLFARNDSRNVTFYCNLALYGFSVRENDTLIQDIIPVLDLSGRPAMYDEVSGQFFYNQGTGEFTWGELDSQTT